MTDVAACVAHEFVRTKSNKKKGGVQTPEGTNICVLQKRTKKKNQKINSEDELVLFQMHIDFFFSLQSFFFFLWNLKTSNAHEFSKATEER